MVLAVLGRQIKVLLAVLAVLIHPLVVVVVVVLDK
jgi:hypothetical protein